MSSMLGENENIYEDLYFSEQIHNYKIYISYNIKEKRNVTLKVINKKDYNDQNLLLKNIQNEQTILNKCKYRNIINFYRYFETDKNFIIEQELYNINLREYLMNYGPLNYKRNFFKEIVINISKALQILYREGIIHRNIRPSSMLLVEKEKNEIKLGEFGKAIFKKDNKSEPLNSIFYTAPEIINGYEYNEKCDLWSFGVSLYELYFGFFPYGKTKSRFYVAKILSDENSFHFKKTNIHTLDKLFEGLLQIDPNKRISHEKMFKLVFNPNFMIKNENINPNIENNKKYQNSIIINESNNSWNTTIISNENKLIFNNILYYDENLSNNHIKCIYRDSEKFENNTLGGFILCTNFEILEIIKKEILRENKLCYNIKFNLITTGKSFEKIVNYIQEDKEFEKCFENYCIYCFNLKIYESYKIKYKNKLHNDIYNKYTDIIEFIKRTSSNNIRPYKMDKLITISKYKNIYLHKYLKIAKFSGTLDDENYKKYYKELVIYIEKMKKQNILKINKDILIKSFQILEIKTQQTLSDEIIIYEFLHNIYHDLNNFISELDVYIEECVAYFTSRIMMCLSSYFYNNKFSYKCDAKKLYMVKNLYFSDLLQYERGKGSIIRYSTFLIFEETSPTNNLSNDSSKFHTTFILECKEENNDIKGIIIKNKKLKNEIFILFLPFTTFKLKDFEYNIKNLTAKIYLESI